MVKKVFCFLIINLFLLQSVAAQEIVNVTKGDEVPFDGILLSIEAASKVLTDRQFSDEECDLRLEYELERQEERFTLLLDYKDIEVASWQDRYEQMMIIKTTENDRLQQLIIGQKPANGPWLVALGFGIGTLTSLGIFALSTQIVQ